MWWKCPECQREINFIKQISDLFCDDGEAKFDPVAGVYFHKIQCDCNSEWILSISEMVKE